MKNKAIPPAAAAAELRGRAEARMRDRLRNRRSATPTPKSEADAQRVLHELQVHQVELEMQNEELTQARNRAETNAQKYSDLYDFAPIGYVSLDDNGRIQELNFTAAKLLGKSRGALTGSLLRSGLAPQDKDTFLRHLRSAAERETRVIGEVGLCSEEGRRVPVQLCTVYRRDDSGQASRYLMAITDITELKRTAEQIRRLNTQLEELVRQRTATIRRLAIELTLAEQRQRLHLAQILHDHLQQLLVGARYHLANARQDYAGSAPEALDKVDESLSQAIEESRNLATELSPPVLCREGLAAALKWLSTWMRDKHGLSVELIVGPRQTSPAQEVSILLYQAVRELLFNVVKHAQVKFASVALDRSDAHVIIVVSDKGKGFDPARLETAGSSPGTFGLFSVRERLALLGGKFEIESAPNRGSRLTLRAPLRPIFEQTAKRYTSTAS